ncbi:universal stress protein [Kiloniella laminariae]|uniref:Universal stress protein n=1 Tax=Kiloniella laminariae TaxID=454162 RepID=A0ABT4LNP9_9PROT|nr:universal stress protein [Kiloniella laminariae]MCZ4282704.1 universal stress protein [Kiloniella laminariae]
MTHKSILVHLANDEEHQTRLDVATRLAKQHDAHVSALFITTPVGMPAEIYGRGASVQFLLDATNSAEKKAAKLEKEFRDTCERNNISYSWVVEGGDHISLLADHAHAADVIILSQPSHEHFEDRFRTRLVEEITLLSGLPCLMIPKGFDASKPIGKRVMVAWKSTREAIRAVRDNLSVLRKADEVLLLSIRPNTQDALSLGEIDNYLERHDIQAKTVKIAETESSIGQTIHDAAETHNCDLLVCGAYGHSRLREMFLGGVTKYLVNHATIPVVMSH